MTGWCPTCRAFTDWQAEACDRCGRELDGEGTDPFFVSGAEPSRAVDLPPGTVLAERFKVLDRCGTGRTGTVYRVFDRIRAQVFAVKATAVALNGLDEAARLQHEVGLYERVRDHRHILKVYGLHLAAWGGGQLVLLAMEHADGGTLRDWMEARRDDPAARREEGLRHAVDLCAGLVELEAVGIAPLDVKPENALIVKGVLKIADLESSVLRGADRVWRVGAGDVRPGALGTPEYMSEEQRRARTSDELGIETAVFAVGVILWELLDPAGQRPTDGAGRLETGARLHPRLKTLATGNDALAAVMAKCLAPRAEDRYPTAAALHEALRAACGIDEGDEARHAADEPSNGAAVSLDAVRDALAEGRCKDAHRECRRALARTPDEPGAREALEELDERYAHAEQLYAAVARDMDTESLESSVAAVSEATSVYPEHPDGFLVQQRVLDRVKAYRRSLEQGWQAVRDRSWSTALASFTRAARTNPGDSTAVAVAEVLADLIRAIAEVRRSIDAALSAQEYDRAMALAGRLDRQIDEAEAIVWQMGRGGETDE